MTMEVCPRCGRDHDFMHRLCELADDWEAAQYGDKRPERYDADEVDGLATAAAELWELVNDR